ncbi:MAG: putative lipid-binding transport protein (Tim44 family)/ribosomal protein L37E [Parvicellaceae bacterium]|jgi:predicted lipid-binding transport protein (Tim44 family)/ribosomal protein L37E
MLLFVLDADARPGGGGGFSSGGGGGFSSGGGSFGGGSGGGGGATDPLTMALILGAVVVFWILRALNKKKGKIASSGASHSSKLTSLTFRDAQLQAFKTMDKNFSKSMFVDFASLMYHKYYHWYGEKEFNNLQPYLTPILFEAGIKPADYNITEIVIGNIELRDISYGGNQANIEVEFEANYTSVQSDGSKMRYIMTERWKFSHNGEWPSQEVFDPKSINCHNCGAPSAFTDSGSCTHCGTLLDAQRIPWYVSGIARVKSQSFKAGDLTTYSPEQGTFDMTLIQPSLNANAVRFTQANAISNWEEYKQNFINEVVGYTFMQIYKAWSKHRWEDVRHLCSDRLFESNEFWINNYKEAGLVNRLDDIKVQKAEVVSIEIDSFYEAITVRIHAACKDYVILSSNNKVVGGSDSKDRAFSEYWTFVRRVGVEKNKMDASQCPNCGAASDQMGQSAVCGYCNTKVNTGEHSWIIATITQDEVYSG